jgi:hypothetical protein
MGPRKKYSIEEVLNFTPDDVQRILCPAVPASSGFSLQGNVKGWDKLGKEERDRCIKHLRYSLNSTSCFTVLEL